MSYVSMVQAESPFATASSWGNTPGTNTTTSTNHWRRPPTHPQAADQTQNISLLTKWIRSTTRYTPVQTDTGGGSNHQTSTPNTPHHPALEAQSLPTLATTTPPPPIVNPTAPAVHSPVVEPSPKKLPLALRRLMDYNKKGIMEYWTLNTYLRNTQIGND